MRTIDADAFKKYIDAQEGRPFIGCTVGEAMKILIDEQPTVQPEKAQLPQEGTTFDMISKFIDGLEEIFADLRERHVDDSVCGLCEYEGAYMGQSGDWCNECPGFDMDDCFKLSDETRKKWTDEIIKALPTIQPEPQWIPVSERLPETGVEVLTYDEALNYIEIQTVSDGRWENQRGDWQDLDDIAAWMPLPEAYKPNNE